MLRIRLSRTGRKNYPSYRIVVAEHARPVKGKFIEIVGHYIPIRDPKVLEFDQEKIQEWIKKGAKPTDTVASLLKNAGMTGLEKYIEPRDKKKKKKKEAPEEEAAQAAPAAEAPTEGSEAPAEKPAEAEDAPKEEPKEKEDAPAAEPEPAPEEPKEEPKPEAEEAPAAAEEKKE